MKIINLFGGPGAGKSTIAAGVFYNMKLIDKYRVELFRELAKDYYYENGDTKFDTKEITEKQFKKVDMYKDSGEIDILILDFSLLNYFIYSDTPFDENNYFFKKFLKLDTLNIFVPRKDRYIASGRSQTEEEALILHKQSKQLMINAGIFNMFYDFTGLPISETVNSITNDLINIT